MRGLFYFLIILCTTFACSNSNEIITPIYKIPTSYTIQDSLVIDGYFDSFAIKQGDSAVLYLNSKKISKIVKLSVNDVNGNTVDFIYCDSIIPQKPQGDSISKNGYNYKYKLKFKLKEYIISGLYQISNKIPFLVKSKSKNSNTIVIYPSNTIAAYNKIGGESFYTLNNLKKHNASILSFHRPVGVDIYSVHFYKKYSESNFDYISDLEMENFDQIKDYKLVIITGHSEYWTRNARLNFDKFIDNRGNGLILSGNTMWWQVRYSEDKKKLICYKENKDPITDPKLRTINWDNKILQFDILPSIGVDFNKGGYGLNPDKGWDGFKIVAPNSPILEGMNLKIGEIISCPSIEYDGTFTLYDSNFSNVRLDVKKLNNFYKIELIGYDFGFRTINTVGTFVVFQKTLNSGYIINTASTDWCSLRGIGGKDGDLIKRITDNCINILSNSLYPFSK